MVTLPVQTCTSTAQGLRFGLNNGIAHLFVLESTEDCETQENEANSEQNAKEGPLELLAKDQGAVNLVDLVLRPLGFALDEGQGEEVAVVFGDLWREVLEQVITVDRHIEEDPLHSDEANP